MTSHIQSKNRGEGIPNEQRRVPRIEERDLTRCVTRRRNHADGSDDIVLRHESINSCLTTQETAPDLGFWFVNV